MTNASVRLIWPDGTELLGEHAHDVLARLGRIQWDPCDVLTMKVRMAQRAIVWSGTAVSPLLSDDDFLDALEGAELLVVDRFAVRAKPAPRKHRAADH